MSSNNISQLEKYDWSYEGSMQERIDKFLSQESDEWSRSQIQGWIKEGLVTVNRLQVKSNYKLQDGDQISLSVPPPEELNISPENIKLDVVYEDKDVIVINKERGLVVHPAPGNYSGTLVNGLLAHCQDLSGINGILRPGIVHRIDKDTSGLIMVAKNDLAHLSLAEQLMEHSVQRKYIAIVHGELEHEQGKIDAPIGRDPHDRKKMSVVASGKKAVTHFKVLERFLDYTLVELKLETGRTHQIRVHMKYIGHPLAGDPKYGPLKNLPINGQALHAQLLGFQHPRTGKSMLFEAPIPMDMQHLITHLDQKM